MSSGKFKKQLSLVDLTMVGLGAIFGSGWLFAASHVASMAGPAGSSTSNRDKNGTGQSEAIEPPRFRVADG